MICFYNFLGFSFSIMSLCFFLLSFIFKQFLIQKEVKLVFKPCDLNRKSKKCDIQTDVVNCSHFSSENPALFWGEPDWRGQVSTNILVLKAPHFLILRFGYEILPIEWDAMGKTKLWVLVRYKVSNEWLIFRH